MQYNQVVISGGGSNSDVVMHIFADVFGIPAFRSKMNNAAGLGSAICAAVGEGLYGSWDQAIENMVSWEPAFAPNEANHGLYQRMAAVYDEVPSLTDKIFERSYEIFG